MESLSEKGKKQYEKATEPRIEPAPYSNCGAHLMKRAVSLSEVAWHDWLHGQKTQKACKQAKAWIYNASGNDFSNVHPCSSQTLGSRTIVLRNS